MFQLSAGGKIAMLGIVAIAVLAVFAPSHAAAPLPDPRIDAPLAKIKGTQTAVFAGGCFWGVEGVFEHVKGVSQVVSGYAGGSVDKPSYEQVSSGTTGHAESVQITYDPSRISFGQLLKVFFSVAHDPTELNRQGPDDGTQYRSEIFYTSDEQKRIAEAYLRQLHAAKVFSKPIVTKIAPLSAFYPAEAHHQDFVARNPNYAYVVYNDIPKLKHLRQEFPDLVKGSAK